MVSILKTNPFNNTIKIFLSINTNRQLPTVSFAATTCNKDSITKYLLPLILLKCLFVYLTNLVCEFFRL